MQEVAIRDAQEQAVLLGPNRSLVGVVSQATVQVSSNPAVVILNSGIIHRVGANRMSVSLCRRLAASGFTAIRFDLSGIGDSEARSDALMPLEASLADIREALDSLEATYKLKRFVLVGLCSGADHSAIYAGTDARVVGAVLLDPSIPRTRRYYLTHYRRRLSSASSWLNVIRGGHPLWGALRRRLAGADRAADPEPAAEVSPDDPQVRAFLAAAYGNTVKCGNRLLAVFTAEREMQHNYREQLLDAFPEVPFGDRLALHYYPDSDHTFTSESNRARVSDLIVDWMKSTDFDQLT
jgi:alpha-beta hydrolase superfamily lysophospholipase